ncbi:hypothetical protein LTR81_007662 [Elasticomyces elasticus]
MSSTVTQTEQSAPVVLPAQSKRMRMDGNDPNAVIKGAIPRENADSYAAQMYDWLEGFNLGFDRNDMSTVHRDKLPAINEKGMCLHYAVTHEDFAWAIRSEPGVVEAFEKVYDDADLLVSFDAINLTLPKYVD